MVTLDFQYGTLVVSGEEADLQPLLGLLMYDDRIRNWRTPARHYAPILRLLHSHNIAFTDRARKFDPIDVEITSAFEPRPMQREAFDAWKSHDCCGVVVLPTGSGKSHLAMMAIAHVRCPTLVVVPTIDLMQQWAGLIECTFDRVSGMLGGGSKDVCELTVSTYASAVLMMEFIGDRFGLIVYDECHHLPGPVNRLAATMAIAPHRLGLTATPERRDDGEAALYGLIGDLCYCRHIDELEGATLAPYRTERLQLPLDPDEAREYQTNRDLYVSFLRMHNISFSNAAGWQQFIGLCARLEGGREVFNAYLRQKRVAAGNRAKYRMIWELLQRHPGERTLIFTADNYTAYEIGRRFFLPVLTQHTRVAERKAFLGAFRVGTYPVLASSRVLNEGIDVPEASVGIVVSGSGSIREHVQRLGRILRPASGKQAMLYELVSEGTSEFHVSDRRRQHRAYQRSAKVSNR